MSMAILEAYEQAAEMLENEGYRANTRKGYSGRGMCGNEVPAIVTDAPGPMIGWAITYVVHVESDPDGDYYGNFEEIAVKYVPQNMDSVGKSTIYY